MKTILGKSLARPLCVVLLASFALAPVAEAQERGGRGGDRGAARGGGGGDRAAARGGGAQANRAQINNTNRDARATNVRNTSSNNVNRANVNRANVNQTNVNRNTNVNASRNVNVNVEGHGGCCGGWDDDDYHPVATAAAVTAAVAVTSAVVGSLVRTVPPNCVPVNQGGVVYQQCGSTWYQPQYVGSQVQYIVVNPPYRPSCGRPPGLT